MLSRVPVQHLLVGLVGRDDHLGGVHDDDVVAGVDVAGERRLVLAAQHAGDLGRHPAEDKTVGVDDVPGALDIAWFW